MSIEAIDWAFKLTLDDPMAKLILLALANHHNPKHEVCWPSLDLLAKETGASKRTIIRATQRLERIGLITIDRSPRKSNIYLLRVNSWQPSWALEAGATEEDLALIGITVINPQAGARDTTSGQSDTPQVPECHYTGATVASHPWQSGTLIIIEPELNLSENRRELEDILSEFEMQKIGWDGPVRNDWAVMEA